MQRKVIYDTDTIYAGADSARFKQNSNIRGWHWCSGKDVTRSITGNQGHVYYKNDGNCTNAIDLADSIYLLMLTPFVTNWDGYTPLYSQSMKFEPTLKLNSNKLDSLIKRTGDNEHQVFGFGNVRGRIVDSISSSNYSRLIIDSSSLQNQVILSNNWPKFLY